MFYVIGDRVYVDGFRPASVAYFGEVEFASGDWVGVVLDMPTGNHDGKIHGRQYFQCSPMHGLFVRPSRITRMPPGLSSSSTASSRQATPLPTTIINTNARYGGGDNTRLSSSSPYIYDEDYRREPNVASLEEKLKSIDINYNNQDDFYRRPSSRTTGILKRNYYPNSRSHSTEPAATSRISSRAEELADRIQKVTQQRVPTATASTSVFNFRPRRTQLSEYENDYSYDDYRSIKRRTPTPSPVTANYNKTVDLSSEPARLGDHVIVRTDRGKVGGILKFLGETNFATGQWAGVQLYKPDGKNDGSVLGYRYFYCPQDYGLFVPASRITKQQSSSDFNSINLRSTIKSPPPLTKTTNHNNNDNRLDSSTSSYNDNNRTPSSASSSAYSSSYSTGLLNNKQPYSASTTSSLASSPMFNMTTTSRLFSDTPLPKSSVSKAYNSPAKMSWNDLIDKDEYSIRKPKFDDRDIEYQLQRSLSKSSLNWSKPLHTSLKSTEKPKSVQYTFTSSKYDGNPIARRTIVYN